MFVDNFYMHSSLESWRMELRPFGRRFRGLRAFWSRWRREEHLKHPDRSQIFGSMRRCRRRCLEKALPGLAFQSLVSSIRHWRDPEWARLCKNLWWPWCPIGRGAQQESWKLCAKMVEIPFRVWDSVLLEICGTRCGERKRHVFDRGGIWWDHVALKDRVLPCVVCCRCLKQFVVITITFVPAETLDNAIGDPKIVSSLEVSLEVWGVWRCRWFAIGRQSAMPFGVCGTSGWRVVVTNHIPRVWWWQLKYFCWKFHPENLGRWTHFDSYFSKGLKPPTSYQSPTMLFGFIRLKEHQGDNLCLVSLQLFKVIWESYQLLGIKIAGWWFQIYFFSCSTLFGEDSHFDEYVSKWLKPPSR